MPEQTWRTVIDINLTGVWHTAKAGDPALRDGGRAASIILDPFRGRASMGVKNLAITWRPGMAGAG